MIYLHNSHFSVSFCWDETFGRYSPLRPKCFPRFWCVCKTDDFCGLGLLLFYRGSRTNPPGTLCSGTWVWLELGWSSRLLTSNRFPQRPRLSEIQDRKHAKEKTTHTWKHLKHCNNLYLRLWEPWMLHMHCLWYLPNAQWVKQKHVMQMFHHMAVDILIVAGYSSIPIAQTTWRLNISFSSTRFSRWTIVSKGRQQQARVPPKAPLFHTILLWVSVCATVFFVHHCPSAGGKQCAAKWGHKYSHKSSLHSNRTARTFAAPGGVQILQKTQKPVFADSESLREIKRRKCPKPAFYGKNFEAFRGVSRATVLHESKSVKTDVFLLVCMIFRRFEDVLHE